MSKYQYNTSQMLSRRRSLRSNTTPQERKVWGLLKNKQISGLRFLRQYSVGAYVLDFFCPHVRLAIEIDGGQHNEKANQFKDEKRTQFLAAHKITVLRFWNNEINDNPDGAYQRINEVLSKLRSNPS